MILPTVGGVLALAVVYGVREPTVWHGIAVLQAVFFLFLIMDYLNGRKDS